MAEFIRNDRLEILTPSGWSDFGGIRRSERTDIVKIVTETRELGCTSDHRLKTLAGFKEVKDITINDEICTSTGTTKLKYYDWINTYNKAFVFDPIEVKLDYEYFSNGFVSHNCEFHGTSGTLISGTKLKQLASCWVPPDTPTSKNSTQYTKPIEGHTYMMICDVSSGKGRDYSAFSVIDVTKMPYDQVYAYQSNMTTPMDYAALIMNVAKQYNKASVLVEVNSIGEQVGHALHYDLEYDNVLFTENAGRAGKRISSGFAKGCDKGIRTTKVVKSLGCSILKLMIEQDQLMIRDYETIQELCTFSLKGNGSYEAEDGKHDDLVMGLVLFAWLSDQQFFRDSTDINTLQTLRDQTDAEIMDDLLFFGFVDDGRGIDVKTVGQFDNWEHVGQWMTWE